MEVWELLWLRFAFRFFPCRFSVLLVIPCIFWYWPVLLFRHYNIACQFESIFLHETRKILTNNLVSPNGFKLKCETCYKLNLFFTGTFNAKILNCPLFFAGRNVTAMYGGSKYAKCKAAGGSRRSQERMVCAHRSSSVNYAAHLGTNELWRGGGAPHKEANWRTSERVVVSWSSPFVITVLEAQKCDRSADCVFTKTRVTQGGDRGIWMASVGDLGQ